MWKWFYFQHSSGGMFQSYWSNVFWYFWITPFLFFFNGASALLNIWWILLPEQRNAGARRFFKEREGIGSSNSSFLSRFEPPDLSWGRAEWQERARREETLDFLYSLSVKGIFVLVCGVLVLPRWELFVAVFPLWQPQNSTHRHKKFHRSNPKTPQMDTKKFYNGRPKTLPKHKKFPFWQRQNSSTQTEKIPIGAAPKLFQPQHKKNSYFQLLAVPWVSSCFFIPCWPCAFLGGGMNISVQL